MEESDIITVGKTFQTYNELERFVQNYQALNFIQLYKRNAQSIAAAEKRRTGSTKIKEDLKYNRINFSCIHGGKKFQTNSTGKRPNTRYL